MYAVVPAALFASATPASAREIVLAVSAAHKATVSADDGWCGSAIRLRLVLQPDSADIGDAPAQSALLGRLGTVIGGACPQAHTADVAVTSSGHSIGRFSGSAAGGWVFTASQAVRPTGDVVRLPAERDYTGALLAFLKQSPALAGDTQVLSFWAALKHPREYQQANGQEFRLQPLLGEARAELGQALSSAPVGLVTISVRVQFGAYDFAERRYPFVQAFDQVSVNRPCCAFADPLPAVFRFIFKDAASLTGLPMQPDAARAFLEARTNRYGNVNRQLLLVMTVQLAPPGFVIDGNMAQASGELRQVVMISTDNQPTEVARLDAAQLAVLREAGAAKTAAAADAATRDAAAQKSAAERQHAEQQRQMLIGQRASLMSELQSASLSVRLANYIGEGPSVNGYAHLSDLRDARAAAVVSGRPVDTAMLVHADESGRRAVATAWPGGLAIEVPDALPRLVSNGWYLVRGTLRVPQGEDVPPAVLEARTIAACEQPKCADLAEPFAILKHKLGDDMPSQP